MENITIKKIIIGLVVFFFFGLYFSHWIQCSLDNRFFFSSLDLNLRIIFDVRSDGNMPLLIARLLHNKLLEGSMYLFNTYSNYWDFRFLLYLLSPMIFSGVLIWIFSVIKRHIQLRMFEKFLVLMSLSFPLLILLGIIKNQVFTLLFFSIPFIIFSLEGFFVISKRNKYFWIVFVLIALISLYLIIPSQMNTSNYCQI